MKTHKTREITQLYLEHGITSISVPRCGRRRCWLSVVAASVLIRLSDGGAESAAGESTGRNSFPKTRFNVLGDDREMMQQLDQQAGASGGADRSCFSISMSGRIERGWSQGNRCIPGSVNSKHLPLVGCIFTMGRIRSTQPADRKAQIHKTYQRRMSYDRGCRVTQPIRWRLCWGGTPAFML